MNSEIKVQSMGKLLEEAIEDITVKASEVDASEGECFSTGLLNLDAVLGGLRPGDVVCIAGTSRSGRHSLACQIGMRAGIQRLAATVTIDFGMDPTDGAPRIVTATPHAVIKFV